jgi:hypothetical protein
MIYIEYISRRPGVSLPEFYAGARAGQTGWAEGYSEDVLLLNVGRTWRVGPQPEYMTIWYSPRAGLERLDAWQEIFESGEAAAVEESFATVARIDAAGCYEALAQPVADSSGPYYVEFFEPTPGVSAVELVTQLERRAADAAGARLVLAVERIGCLGPDPACLAFWQLPRFSALEQVARRRVDEDSPRVVAAGLYADFGREIL